MFRTWSAPSMVPKKLRNTLKDKIIKNKDTRNTRDTRNTFPNLANSSGFGRNFEVKKCH